MIEAIDLTKSYGTHQAVKGISFFVEEGKTVGFLGGNGAGKSTTMRMLTGFLRPTSGIARINGIDVNEQPIEARRSLGYLPENTPLYPDMRVREFLTYRAKLKGIRRGERKVAIDSVLESCWLSDVQTRIIGHLSKGYRQRVGLADCLLGDPKLLILDEPTVGLDPNQVRQTRQLIQEIGQKRTIFLSTHILHEVELSCEEVVIINKGELVARGKTRELCANYDGPRHLRLRFGAEAIGDIEQELRKVRGIEDISQSGETGGLIISCEGDPRREISRLAGEKGWLVEEMTLEPVRLEEIFSRLTQKHAPNP
jgi:ABC-2 type transport system ATP-binding protein